MCCVEIFQVLEYLEVGAPLCCCQIVSHNQRGEVIAMATSELLALLASKRGFVQEKVDSGKVPNAPQLVGFLKSLCDAMRPLVGNAPQTLKTRLKKEFLTIGWDVSANGPTAGSQPPTALDVLAFLTKAASLIPDTPAAPATAKTASNTTLPPAAKIADKSGRPAPLKLEEDSVATATASAPSSGSPTIMFGAPEVNDSGAATQADDARAGRQSRLAGTPGGERMSCSFCLQ